ncbi:hypothetical protein B5V03_04755 [Bradyrhizobium betae]|uniref:Uncharacterized protein n=1 Tax=Bradyrhizobium betae TaxID=244734 RepID=A0A4Q1VGK5_9BRAD|nr:hypothetical protein B5V03_04755 [Bradyrhizobium betae]
MVRRDFAILPDRRLVIQRAHRASDLVVGDLALRAAAPAKSIPASCSFSGKRWNNEIYPLLRDFVHVNS